MKLSAHLLPYLLCFDCGWCKWGTIDKDGKAVFKSPS